MGNTQKRKAQPGAGKGLAAYRAEAKGEPFRLPLDDDDGTALVIPRPSGEQMLDAEEQLRRGSSRGFLVAMAGEQADALLAALGPEDAAVMRAVAADMQEYFGLGE